MDCNGFMMISTVILVPYPHDKWKNYGWYGFRIERFSARILRWEAKTRGIVMSGLLFMWISNSKSCTSILNNVYMNFITDNEPKSLLADGKETAKSNFISINGFKYNNEKSTTFALVFRIKGICIYCRISRKELN